MREEYKENLKNSFLKQIENMNQQDSIEHIKELIFSIDMIDRWQEEDKIAHDILVEILRKLQMGVKL